MTLQFHDDLFDAIVSSIATSTDDNSVVEQVACDTLHALSSWFHSNAGSFALLVRVTDSRVLATTVDYETPEQTDDTAVSDSDVAARSACVSNTLGQKLTTRCSRLSNFLNDLDDTNWTEESSFELDGGWFVFQAYARLCGKASSIALLVLARRRAALRQSSINSIATTSSTEDSPRSLVVRSSSMSSGVGGGDDDNNNSIRDVVRAIDDQYVLAVFADGTISACSTLIEALFDRHGHAQAVRISDSLHGGQQTWNRLTYERTDLPLPVALSDGTNCTIRLSPTSGALYVVVLESIGQTPQSSPVVSRTSSQTKLLIRSTSGLRSHSGGGGSRSGDEEDELGDNSASQSMFGGGGGGEQSSSSSQRSSTMTKSRIKRRLPRTDQRLSDGFAATAPLPTTTSGGTAVLSASPPYLSQTAAAATAAKTTTNRALHRESSESSRINSIISWVRRRADSTGGSVNALPSSTATGGRIVRGYQFQKEIARGGDGVVSLATHLASNETVAMKKRHCNDVQEVNLAFQEAMTLARASSEFVVEFRDAFFEELVIEGKQMFELYIACEYCNGGDLFNKLMSCSRDKMTYEHSKESAAQHASLPLKKWSVQMATAIASLHQVGIVHRDIKLENFVIRDNGSLCLIDFGISAVYGKTDVLTSGQSGSTVVGSTYYLAPELFDRKSVRNNASSLNSSPIKLLATNLPTTITTTATTTPFSTAVVIDSSSPNKSASLLSSSTTNNNAAAVKFGGDLWSLGVVLLELTSCHVFQLRKDRLMLGKLALDCNGDAARWQRLLAPFLTDITSSMASSVHAISALLVLDRAARSSAESVFKILR